MFTTNQITRVSFWCELASVCLSGLHALPEGVWHCRFRLGWSPHAFQPIKRAHITCLLLCKPRCSLFIWLKMDSVRKEYDGSLQCDVHDSNAFEEASAANKLEDHRQTSVVRSSERSSLPPANSNQPKWRPNCHIASLSLKGKLVENEWLLGVSVLA